MAVMLSHPQDVRPPSPALTDPDMILPFNSPLPESDSPPAKPTPAIISELTPPTTSRPTLPGAWLSEEDILPIQSEPISQNGLKPNMPMLPLKSPIGRFLHTIDPKLRSGMGVEAAQYSPSIYSPTDSVERTPGGLDEHYEIPPFPMLIDDKTASEEDEDDDIMGAKAEQILANAKQKLLAMENNLNRARTLSLGTTNGENVPSTVVKKMPMRLQKTANGSSSHLRISSETTVPNGKPIYDPNIRSASALGSPSPFSSFVHKHHHLEPLDEDDLISAPTSDIEQPRTSMKDLQDQMNNLKGKINSLKERTREDNLRRRSLQALKAPSPFTDADVIAAPSPYLDHMRPASNSSDRSAEFLGDRASPDQIENDGLYHIPLVKFRGEESEGATRETFLEHSSEDGEEIAPYHQQGDQRSVLVAPSRNVVLVSPASQQAVFDHVDNDNTSQAAIIEQVDAEEPESMIPSSPTYNTDFLKPGLPPIKTPTSPAHEDRPDAFDYETYVLNSTMGSFSRSGFHHSRSNSEASGGSTSTQRPSYNHESPSDQRFLSGKPSGRMPHGRTDSIDSTSTTATFATAATGDHGSRANSRTSRKGTAIDMLGFLSPNLPPKSSYTSLRQALNTNHQVHESSHKRNSFSPLPSPSRGAFPLPAESSYVSPQEARQQILSLLLRTASPATPKLNDHADVDADAGRCWAPEDEHLVGAVVDGLIKVIGRVVRGEDEGDAGRSILESIGAVLQK